MASAAITKYVLDPLERVGSTLIQQFSVVLLATGTGGLLVTQNWYVALITAAFAGLVTLLLWGVQTLTNTTFPGKLDLIARVAKTWLASFSGALAASGVSDVIHVSWQSAAAVATAAAATALLKGLIAFNKPGTISPASLVTKAPTAA